MLSKEIDIIYLVPSIRIKWWTKFNIDLIKKERIDEWVKNSQQVSLDEKQGEKEALFLAEKQKIMAALAAATSEEEFEERSRVMRAHNQKKFKMKKPLALAIISKVMKMIVTES